MIINRKIAYIISGVWLFVILYLVISNLSILRNGQEVLLKTIPVDPRDLFRGDYVTLRYEISDIRNIDRAYEKDPYKFYRRRNGNDIYIVLETDENNIAKAKWWKTKRPKNRLFIKGKVQADRIQFNDIESYFIKENTGRAIESKINSGEVYAKVKINKIGQAKIQELVFK